MPASPVHAFAQPLLTTIALARPPDFDRCSRETTTGAATALLVVNTAAADTGASGDDQREIERRDARPTPAALDAAGDAGGAKAARGGDAARRSMRGSRDAAPITRPTATRRAGWRGDL